jgi:hypothetical protein
MTGQYVTLDGLWAKKTTESTETAKTNKKELTPHSVT